MTQDWTALAREIRARRDELGLTQEQVAARGGPSTATMRLLEGALQDSYRHRTFVDLERGLEWPRGHARQILTGTVSTQVAADPGAGTSNVPPRGAIDAAELLANDPTLSPASREHIVNQYRLLQQLSALEVRGVDEEDPDERAIAESRELSPAQKQEALQTLRERRGATQSDRPVRRRGVQ